MQPIAPTLNLTVLLPVCTSSGHSLSFFDNYESAGGVPTFVVRPDVGRLFTNCVLSEDGTLFATGDFSGKISLWNAANCSLIMEFAALFREKVQCLSFMDGRTDSLVVVGDGGTLKEFSIEEESSEAAHEKATFLVTGRQRNTLKLDDTPDFSSSTAWQISRDGRTFAFAMRREDKVVFWVYRIRDASSIDAVELSSEDHDLTVPSLSSNGQSVMTFCQGNLVQTRTVTDESVSRPDGGTHVAVWPVLHFAEEVTPIGGRTESRISSGRDVGIPNWKSAPVALDGLVGTWGKEGDFLLLWKISTDDHGPILEIYKTSDLIPGGSRVFARRTLDRGLLTWDAQILDHCSRHEGLIVAVYESFDLSRRRLLLWNAELDVVCTEVYVPVPAKCLDDVFTEDQARRWAINEETLDSLLESGMVDDRMSESCYHSKVADILRPKFAVNSDHTIAVFFSWRFEAVVMVSLTSGATLWQCNLPPSMRSNPFCMINTCRFDKSEGRVMVVGKEAILAFAPSCLTCHSPYSIRYRSHLREAKSSDGFHRSCLEDYYHLPGKALTKWISDLLSWASESENPVQLPEDLKQRRKILDAAVSADGRRIAFIADCDRNYKVFLTEKQLDVNQEEFHRKAFLLQRLVCVGPRRDAREVFPTSVFLVKSPAISQDILFITCMSSQTINFSHFGSLQMQFEVENLKRCLHLFNAPCLSSSQTLEGNVLLLGIQEVHVFDFKHLTRTTIAYTSNFATTIRRFDPHQWRSVLKRHRKISDDGKHVLIGWNETIQRCLVITPEMTTEYVEHMIDVVGKDISFDCAISHDGEWIAYASVHKESDCQLFIGIYKIAEERTMQMLSMDMGPERDELMSSLFFSFSPNGDHIILANCAWEEDQRSPIFLLTPHDADGWFPDERQLRLTVAGKSEETPRCIQEFYSHYGKGICNMPGVTGLSMLEAAYLENDNLIIQAMKNIASDHGFGLSMPCMLSSICDDTSMHPLQHTFRNRFLNSRGCMKEVMSLICQRHLSINHGAAILKDIFVDVWIRYPDIIKDVLSENTLMIDICTLNVHEDFFSEEEDPGVHIETADTVMEWGLLHEEKHNLVWRDRHLEILGEGEDDDASSSAAVTLRVVCLEDIAQIGRKGILRKLLLQNVSDYFYKCNAVKWTIALKWKVFWKERCKSYMKGYALVVLLFTVYAWRVGSGGNFQNRKIHDLVLEMLLLSPCWFYARWMLGEEIQQIRSLMADGQWFLRSRRRGLSIYFKSKWNWVQLTSCALLLVFIPCFHVLAYCYPAHSLAVAVSVGIESIFIWFKIWYHAQALKAMGPLVLMINNIIEESRHFLFLALTILVGFSLALFVMFNHLLDNGEGSDYRNEAEKLFGTLPNSFLTLFCALFGNFSPELYLLRADESAPITIVFFCYMFVETVVLLNMLIAIMGDTFDRVRSREESQLLKGRAQYIDAGEAALNQRQRIAYE